MPYPVSDTYRIRIHPGYTLDTYPIRIGVLGCIGPGNSRLDTYLWVRYGPTAHLESIYTTDHSVRSCSAPLDLPPTSLRLIGRSRLSTGDAPRRREGAPPPAASDETPRIRLQARASLVARPCCQASPGSLHVATAEWPTSPTCNCKPAHSTVMLR